MARFFSLLHQIFLDSGTDDVYRHLPQDMTEHYLYELPEPHSFDGIYVACIYDATMERDIKQFKYQSFREYGDDFIPVLSDLFDRYLPPDITPADIYVTGVPMHWTRYVVRGFNQTVFLAKGVARCRGISYRSLLKKRVYTPHQAGLSREARIHEKDGVYSLRKGVKIDGKIICIIDDVISTGSTFEACAKVLKAGGAHKVYGFFLARGG